MPSVIPKGAIYEVKKPTTKRWWWYERKKDESILMLLIVTWLPIELLLNLMSQSESRPLLIGVDYEGEA